MSRVPSTAYEDYLALGEERSYRALAEQLGVSRTAIVNRAKKEKWQERIAALEREARRLMEEQAVNEMKAVRARHLKEARFLQARALQVLRDQPPERGIRAATALAAAWKHELLLLGEPTERSANVEELIKRETQELLRVVRSDEPGTGRAGHAD